MPIKTQSDLPAKELLERENTFVMDEARAMHQDIRPIEIGILNLMPLKEETELQLLRAMSNTPLQINVSFIVPKHHEAKNTPKSHLNKFYTTFTEAKTQKFDGLIITGAPLEQMEYEEVDYWREFGKICEWTKTNVTSTMHVCWGAQAALYHHYGIPKYKMDEKMFGVFEHKVLDRRVPLVMGFDDVFLAPHSRHTEVRRSDIDKVPELEIVAESEQAGVFLVQDLEGKKVFVMGHPEYDRMTLHNEYMRDKEKGLSIRMPYNYYIDGDTSKTPNLKWRSHANNLYTNWLNYYVYQVTPYEHIKI
ncbi:homoserine O-succinyltransferase [Lachnospiraceae bacterium ZAX-1]